MVGEIRQSLENYPREQLVEILSYVFKEYVVEGAAPIAGTTALIDARTELEGLSFAELITWLQLHLDVPELAQFEVQGPRVFVRSGGRALPVEAPRVEPLAAPPPSPQSQPQPQASPPVATPSVSARPMPSAPPPAQLQPAAAPPQAQPAAPASATPAGATPSPPANAAQPANEPKKDEPGTGASRFSWLEVD
jgi:hypothetical protein